MRCSQALAYTSQDAPVSLAEWQRDYTHIDDRYTLQRLRTAYRTSRGLVIDEQIEEYRKPPQERQRALTSDDPCRLVAVLTDTDT
jgi:hypothetical protein